ncbi:hypothetical protein LINPERPRIM_LOCUS37425 [Linum perenne]
MASRYNSYHSSRSSASSFTSDPASSAEFKPSSSSSSSSRALVKSNKPSDLSQLKPTSSKSKPTTHNLSALVKKFMDKKSTPTTLATKGSSKNPPGFLIPPDLIAEDLKKTAKKGPALVGLQKKLFGKEKEKKKKEVKALTEVKGYNNGGNVANTRTLAMVLRSERELLCANKEMEAEVSELRSMLETKNREVEKLKDLCLKQREEIKSLKNAVLFPDVMNSQLQDVLEQQGSELKQAKQIIPNLQRQVTSLTGQLQCLAEGLAEVKAEKYGRVRCSSSPKTPSYDYQGSANSLDQDDFSSCGATTPGSPDDMFVKDLNPCLTPYGVKTKSKEFDELGYDCASSFEEYLPEMQTSDELTFSSGPRKLSRSSDRYQSSNAGSAIAAVRAARRSDESKYKLGKQIYDRVA